MKFYKEIPFKCEQSGVVYACPEAIYVESVTRKRGFLDAKKFAEQRPYFLMLDPEGVQAIIVNWKQHCRNAEDQCNQDLGSVMSLLVWLDEQARKVSEGKL